MEREFINKLISKKLKQVRKARRMTQKHLSKLLNKSQSFVNQVEQGKVMPSIDTFVNICNALQVEPTDMLIEYLCIPAQSKQLKARKLFFSLCEKDQCFIINMMKLISQKT